MSTTAISIRLDSDIKKQFENLCKEFGLSTNAAFNLFARTVVREQAIPFPITLNRSESEKRSKLAQKALDRVQSLSAQEAHEWTEEYDCILRLPVLAIPDELSTAILSKFLQKSTLIQQTRFSMRYVCPLKTHIW